MTGDEVKTLAGSSLKTMIRVYTNSNTPMFIHLNVCVIHTYMYMTGDEVKTPAGSSLKVMSKPTIEAEIIEVEEIAEDIRARIESEEVPTGMEGAWGGASSSTAAAAGGSSGGGASAVALGLDAVKLLAAQSGLSHTHACDIAHKVKCFSHSISCCCSFFHSFFLSFFLSFSLAFSLALVPVVRL